MTPARLDVVEQARRRGGARPRGWSWRSTSASERERRTSRRSRAVPIQPAVRPGSTFQSSEMTIVPASGSARTSQAAVVALIRAAPRPRRRRSGSGAGTAPTIRPRPIVTSHAATTITISAKTWPSRVAPHAREADQREVARVQHQLEAEQDHERVAAREHAGERRCEDERRQDDVPGDAHDVEPAPSARGRGRRGPSAVPAAGRVGSASLAAEQLPSGPPSSRCRASWAGRPAPRQSASGRPRRLRASTTAPTAATSSRIDAASNGDQELLRAAASPIAPGEPKPRGRPPRPRESSAVEARADDRDRELHQQRDGEQRRRAWRERAATRCGAAPARRRCRRRRRRRAPSPRPRRRRSAPPRGTRRSAAGTASPARTGARPAPAPSRTGCARGSRPSAPPIAPNAAMKKRTLLHMRPTRPPAAAACARGGRLEQHLLREDQVRARVVRQLEVVAHRDRVERARDLAVAAEDAAQSC